MVQVSGGFLEGIIRGYKAGLLTQGQYNNLTQCETIEGTFVLYSQCFELQLISISFLRFSTDFRTQLSATDYGNFLANEPLPISTSTINERALQIMVDQFNFIKSNAVEPLSTFLDYITCVFYCFARARSESLPRCLRHSPSMFQCEFEFGC